MSYYIRQWPLDCEPRGPCTGVENHLLKFPVPARMFWKEAPDAFQFYSWGYVRDLANFTPGPDLIIEITSPKDTKRFVNYHAEFTMDLPFLGTVPITIDIDKVENPFVPGSFDVFKTTATLDGVSSDGWQTHSWFRQTMYSSLHQGPGGEPIIFDLGDGHEHKLGPPAIYWPCPYDRDEPGPPYPNFGP